MLSRILGVLLVAVLVMAQAKPDPQAMYKAGYDARIAGDYSAAIRLLSAAIGSGKLNNNDLATSYNNRGMAFAATGELDKAIADYSAAIKIAPAYGPAYLNRGNVYSEQGKLDAAIAEFDMLIKLFPDYVLPYNSRGAAYYRKGELDKAIADFDAAIRLKPDYGNAFWNRARAYGRKGDRKQSLADFDAAVRFKPKEPGVLVDRATAREALKNVSGAIADLDAAIALDPKVPLPYYQRGNVRFGAGDIDQALADYDRAIRLAPTYADPVTNRGRIELFHTNRPVAAAADLATGVRLDPNDIYAAIWLHIARSRSGTPDHAELAANAKALGAGDWPWPVVQLFLGAATPDAVLSAAAGADDEQTRQEQLCEANFYLGMFRLDAKAADDAKKLIALAAEKCPAGMLEKAAAKAELARLSR
jgi:lipoprotein NlpI